MRNKIIFISLMFMIVGKVFSQQPTFLKERIINLYKRGKYEKLLICINKIENKGVYNSYTYHFKGKYKDSPDFYFYKTSALIQTEKHKIDFEYVFLNFKQLYKTGDFRYKKDKIFNKFKYYIDSLSKEEFKRDNITKTIYYCEILKKYWYFENTVYLIINSHINLKSFTYDDIKRKDFSKIDSIARNAEKKNNIRDQTWVLTKNLKTDVERIRSIYTWIILNISYDDEQRRKAINRIYVNVDAELVFQKRKTICSGYSNLFVEMCKYAHIKSIVDTGKEGEYYHAWNKVNLDGQIYFIDLTWSDRDNVIDETYFLALNRK